MNRVLFIIHDVYKEDNNFPLGPAYLASILLKNNVDVDVYCMDVYHYTNDDLAEHLKKNEYDIIGLGFLSARFKETIIDLCKTINKYKKNAWLVLGGHGPSAIPNYILDETKCDSVIVGEAENAIMEILKDKKDNKNKIIYRRDPCKKLDDLPFPAWHLFPMEIYTNCKKYIGMDNNEKSINIMTSRGCVNKCTFCYRIEKGYRVRSMENVMEEIKILHDKYGITYFEFSDECFILNEKRLNKFVELLKKYNLNIKYWCAARVDLVNENILKLLKMSGCQFINYGFESMDLNVLKNMRKNTTPEQNDRAAKLTKKYGIPFGLNFIWNLPGDTIESLHKNKEFIKKYNSYEQMRTIRPVTPYPGCELYYYAIEKGLLNGPEDFFNKFKNSDLITVNFTNLKEEDMYDELFVVNKELVSDHINNTTKNQNEIEFITKQYKNLYKNKNIKFRGVRHYEK